MSVNIFYKDVCASVLSGMLCLTYFFPSSCVRVLCKVCLSGEPIHAREEPGEGAAGSFRCRFDVIERRCAVALGHRFCYQWNREDETGETEIMVNINILFV